MVVDTFQTEKVTSQSRVRGGTVAGEAEVPARMEALRPRAGPLGKSAVLALRVVPRHVRSGERRGAVRVRGESFLTDGFEELGTATQQIAARLFRNPPSEGIHVVRIDPEEKLRVIGAMEGNVSVVPRWAVVYEDRDRLPLVAPVVGRKAILRNGMITGLIDLKRTKKSYPFRAHVDGAVKSWVASGGYFHCSDTQPINTTSSVLSRRLPMHKADLELTVASGVIVLVGLVVWQLALLPHRTPPVFLPDSMREV